MKKNIIFNFFLIVFSIIIIIYLFIEFYSIIFSFIDDSLGWFMLVLGLLATFLVYAMTHKGSVLMVGITVSFILGGTIGIANIMLFDCSPMVFEEPTKTEITAVYEKKELKKDIIPLIKKEVSYEK